MVYPSVLEAALHRFIANNPLRSQTTNVEGFVNRFTEHIRVVFNMMRVLKMEDIAPAEPGKNAMPRALPSGKLACLPNGSSCRTCWQR
jgi:hypothetical protein